MPDPFRRLFLKALSAIPLFAATPSRAAVDTPPQTEGPFYPRPAMRGRDQDNDLVRVASLVRDAGGEVMRLTGHVLDTEGAPLPDARVEIWQVDMNGRYLHTGDSQNTPRHPAFQGFGHAVTDEEGTYVFRTIKPVPYPGRTPHIHVKVFKDDRERLTTQFYIDGHPLNARDGLWRRLSAAERAAVAMRFEEKDGVPTAVVEIQL